MMEVRNKSQIAVFIFGLFVTILFIIPCTLLILLTPYLMKLSHWRIFFLINRIKPLVDSHEAPLKDRYRFWTGAMLIYRIALVIASAYFSQRVVSILKKSVNRLQYFVNTPELLFTTSTSEDLFTEKLNENDETE